MGELVGKRLSKDEEAKEKLDIEKMGALIVATSKEKDNGFFF